MSHFATKLRAAVLALIMAGAANPASATPPDAPGNGAFLALGDSVVFGFITQAGYAYVNPNNFVGYPDYVGDDLRLDTANAACPGETTSSFSSPTDPGNGCLGFKSTYPLHVAYTSTQLGYATKFLATHKHTKLVTITLGANDIFVLQNACSGDLTCIQNGLPAVLSTIYLNMNSILKSLRATGFGGVLMVVNYYSLDYTSSLETGITTALNQTLAAVAAANGAVVADAFTAFKTAASTTFASGVTCKTGLLNVSPASQTLCDVHPSQSGQQLLSDTIEATYGAALGRGKGN
jgi:lysophospholipase L1-like esterase